MEFKILSDAQTSIHRDLKLNFQKLMESSSLTLVESHLALLALATASGNSELQSMARQKLKALDISEEQILEAAQAAAIMGMLNTYYKFRTMIKRAHEGEAADSYSRAGLRMNSLNAPALDKAQFEQLAFAVSVLNGCESCIAAHEKTLLELGLNEEKIHDLARLAAVVAGVSALYRA